MGNLFGCFAQRPTFEILDQISWQTVYVVVDDKRAEEMVAVAAMN